MYLTKSLRELQKLSVDSLLQNRYEKFRRMGVFLESAPESAGAET